MPRGAASGRVNIGAGGAAVTPAESETRRLRVLYEVSRELSRARDPESAARAVIALTRRAVPLRTAVFVETRGLRASVWAPEPGGHDAVARACQHAAGPLAFLIGAPREAVVERLADAVRAHAQGPVREGDDGGAGPRDLPGAPTRYITLPLVVEGQAPLGALQLETEGPVAEEELAFVSAVVNQLAMALDRREAWDREVMLRARAETAEETERKVLAMVSHDLKNPLSVILIGIRSLEASAEDEFTRKKLEAMLRASQRITRLLDDLLVVARLEAGFLSLERRAAEPEALLSEAVASMEPVAAQKSITLVLEPPRDPLPAIFADRDRIQQVLANLLGNAVKFTPRGGRVTLAAEARESVVCFTVRDTGPGLDAESRARVFDRFWQAAATRQLGTGLGLSIVKDIVNAHGGAVWVESEPGQGSTFCFTVPVCTPAGR